MLSIAVTLRVFKVPVKVPLSCLLKVPRVIAMTCLPFRFEFPQDRSCDGSRSETARGVAHTASVQAAGAQRRTRKAEEFGAALAPRPRGSRLAGRGNSFVGRVCGRRLRDLALCRASR